MIALLLNWEILKDENKAGSYRVLYIKLRGSDNRDLNVDYKAYLGKHA